MSGNIHGLECVQALDGPRIVHYLIDGIEKVCDENLLHHIWYSFIVHVRWDVNWRLTFPRFQRGLSERLFFTIQWWVFIGTSQFMKRPWISFVQFFNHYFCREVTNIFYRKYIDNLLKRCINWFTFLFLWFADFSLKRHYSDLGWFLIFVRVVFASHFENPW